MSQGGCGMGDLITHPTAILPTLDVYQCRCIHHSTAYTSVATVFKYIYRSQSGAIIVSFWHLQYNDLEEPAPALFIDPQVMKTYLVKGLEKTVTANVLYSSFCTTNVNFQWIIPTSVRLSNMSEV